jgi:sugar-phosphatase
VLELIGGALAHEAVAAAIATSSTRRKSEAVLTSAGVPYRQMAYVCGDDITRKKPDPQVFQVACRRLGLPPDRCIVVEYAPSGIQAARAAGCRCLAVTNTCPRAVLDAEHPDIVVASLAEVTVEDLLALPAG